MSVHTNFNHTDDKDPIVFYGIINYCCRKAYPEAGL